MRTDLLNEYDDFLSTGELSKALNIHINTIRRWSDKGLIKNYRFGPRKDRQYIKNDVLEFLDKYLEKR